MSGAPDEVITERNMQATYGVDVRIVQLEEGGVRKACFPALSNPSENASCSP